MYYVVYYKITGRLRDLLLFKTLKQARDEAHKLNKIYGDKLEYLYTLKSSF